MPARVRAPGGRAHLLAALGVLASSLVAACASGDEATTPDATSGETTTTTVGAGGATTTSTPTGGGGATTTTTTGAGGQGGSGGAPLPSICPPDGDGDQIADEVEGRTKGTDTDGDGTADWLDLDSDGDTLPDQLEGQTASNGCGAPQDSDGDGTPDFQDTDADANGLPDRDELYPDGEAYDAQLGAPNPADTDGDHVPDYADDDNDGDTLVDAVELGEDDGAPHAGPPIDSDGDGVPDLDDTDSDGDGIADAFEGVSDPDGDGVPAFRDADADGDGLPDACEAGAGQAHAPGDPPADTDADGTYDFLDRDSDNDGVPDAEEDANQDCVLDDGETDPFAADTDGDGVNDLLERTLGSDPRDPLATPASLGKFFFVLPYQLAPEPATSVVPIRTTLNRGDVGFVVDTTALMGPAIQALKTGMNDVIIGLHGAIPDVAVGVAGHDDFPLAPYGSGGVDAPFYVAGPKGFVSTSLSDNLGAVAALNVHDGLDSPQSQLAAYRRALTDELLLWPSGALQPTGAPGGTSGSLHFRDGALPILVGITTNPFHGGRRAKSPGARHDVYSFDATPPFPTPTADDLVATMKAKGAQFIGISLADGARAGADPYEDMAWLADQTGAYVSPSAFGGKQCGTGIGGTFGPPDGPATLDDPGGTCRLVFDVAKSGAGLTTSIVSGVKALLASLKLDMRVVVSADPADPVDAVDTFVESIEVWAPGGDDPSEPGAPCFSLDPVKQLKDAWEGPKGLVKAQDSVNETALGVVPGQKICFSIVPKANASLPQLGDGPQVFTAWLSVRATRAGWPGELVLGEPHAVAFIVPPAPQ